MYEELVALLRKQYDKAPMVMEAAEAIEDLEFACNRYEKDYKALCKYLPKWIPVAEREPEKYTHNLVYSNETGIDILYFGSRGLFQDYHSDEIKGITHWMQLPAPPREEA